MLRELKSYILENEFKINYIDGKINIVNYINIDHFDDNKIIVRHSKGYVTIKGEDLSISKLLIDEMLVSGKIKVVEIN